MIRPKLTSHRALIMVRQVLFWLSNLALLTITSYCALMITVFRDSFIMRTGPMTWAKIPAFFPAVTVLLVIVSAFSLIRSKRSSLLFKLFFAVELPLLLIGFARVVFNMYPSTVLFLSIVILFSSFAIWYDILWGQKNTKFNKKVRPYFFLPYLASSIVSGWIFLVWVFWVPYAGWQVFSHLDEIVRGAWESIFVSWLVIPSLITVAYFFLSPALAFGMLLWETYKHPFPRKQLVVLGGILVVIGGTFALDTLEKRGPQADLYEAARKLHITATTDEVPFSKEDLSSISNFNRLRESITRVYLAGLKYPIHSINGWRGEGATNGILDAVRQTYCPAGCDGVARMYETLFFPLIYNGNITDDRTLAEKVYAFVFDGSLQNDNGDTILRLKNRSILGYIGWKAGWNSVEASALKQNDTLVHLDVASYDITVNQDIGVYTNVITYTLGNTTVFPQEAFMEFLLPDTHAVITDLRLGQNLELPSTVAPRGAAKRVYSQSVHNRIDPALLEQVGPRQYRLRVFPIPADDVRSEGVQKVQVEYTAFIPPEGMIEVTTPMTTRNIGIDRFTAVTNVAVDEHGKKLPMSTVRYADITKKVQFQATVPYSTNTQFTITGPANSFVTFTRQKRASEQPSVFFLDNSASANTKDVRNYYQKLRQKYDAQAKFYTYNFQVQPLARSEEISFWGPTDSRALVRMLSDPQFEGQHVAIITDDNNVEIKREEETTLNYAQISTLKTIDSIVVGSAIPIFKNELTLATAAAQNEGTVSLIAGKNAEVTTNAFDVRWSLITRQSDRSVQQIDEPQWREALEDLWAFSRGKEQIRHIVNADTWENAANAQAVIATKAHIVNQFASLIALQTDWQKQALERESQAKNKYRSDHDIGEVPNQDIFIDQAGDEPPLIVLLLIVMVVLPIPLFLGKLCSLIGRRY